MKLTIIFLLALMSILLLVGCGSATDPSVGTAMDNDATVIKQTDVGSNMSMATIIGSLDVGDSVKVTHKSPCGQLCLVESSELTGWVMCSKLEIEE